VLKYFCRLFGFPYCNDTHWNLAYHYGGLGPINTGDSLKKNIKTSTDEDKFKAAWWKVPRCFLGK